MKHFLVEITYHKPVEEMADIVAEHRRWLQIGYQRGWYLFSGPQASKKGGILIARAPSQEELEAFFRDDPYQVQGVASHRFVEFTPVFSQDFLKEVWIDKE